MPHGNCEIYITPFFHLRKASLVLQTPLDLDESDSLTESTGQSGFTHLHEKQSTHSSFAVNFTGQACYPLQIIYFSKIPIRACEHVQDNMADTVQYMVLVGVCVVWNMGNKRWHGRRAGGKLTYHCDWTIFQETNTLKNSFSLSLEENEIRTNIYPYRISKIYIMLFMNQGLLQITK